MHQVRFSVGEQSCRSIWVQATIGFLCLLVRTRGPNEWVSICWSGIMNKTVRYALLLSISYVVTCSLLWAVEEPQAATETDAHVRVRLRGIRDRVELGRGEDGALNFYLRTDKGEIQVLTPEEFAARVYGEQSRQSWWNRFLNVTSPIGIAWVGLGFLGQLMFTGRMLVQWLVSEREQRSVVPPVFWWMSLAGASMLLVYFVWRRDIVGVVGQTTGWIIYLRNIWLIYHSDGVSETELIQS